jgi:hypothetical protein
VGRFGTEEQEASRKPHKTENKKGFIWGRGICFTPYRLQIEFFQNWPF